MEWRYGLGPAIHHDVAVSGKCTPNMASSAWVIDLLYKSTDGGDSFSGGLSG